jgi:hypothetical protein
MSPRRRVWSRALRLGAVAILTPLAASRAGAQVDTLSGHRKSPRQVFTVQPIQSIAGILSGDYEVSVGGPVTLGVGASYWNAALLGLDLDDARASYVSGEVKARFYPGERPFEGVSVGLTLGGAHASASDAGGRFRSSGLKTGAEVDYNWLLGDKRQLAIATGIGAKRIFYTMFGDRLVGTYPTMRLAIGWAF